MTGKATRHGTQTKAVPSILEDGRICASTTRGVHKFTTSCIYGCYEIELSPMRYDTPVHITDFNDLQWDRANSKDAWWNCPGAQCVCSEEEKPLKVRRRK